MKIKKDFSIFQQDVISLALSCAVGLEPLIISEADSFGGSDIHAEPGIVMCMGSLEMAYRCCLWSRYSSRVMVQISSFNIIDEEDLYRQCCEMNWPQLFSITTTFAVSCTLSKNAAVQHSRYVALKVKDAIVDTFRDMTGERPTVRTQRPDIQLHLHIQENKAVVYIDFSGESLHRRGYRDTTGIAPLKETLGAAIVSYSGWIDTFCDLVDPMCGSGTLLIEAAMMFGDVAPGLSRSYFGFNGWLGHKENLWQQLVEEAIAREEAGLAQKWPVIRGYDNDPEAIRAARKNIDRAGLDKHIHIEQRDIAFLQPSSGKKGMVISNLPYGERLSETDLISSLYRGIGRILRQRLPGWQVALFISNPVLTDSFSMQFHSRYKLMNGSIACRLLVGDIVQDDINFTWQIQNQALKQSEDDFSNRFRKNLKSILKWANSNNINCFRVYDRDLPEYNLAVDIYGKWIHIQEYVPPKSVDEKLAEKRFAGAVRAIKTILNVRSDRVFLKKRQRQRGKQQYTKQGSRGKFFEVQEGNCYFLVNFTDYLDTGLFLDHRPVRTKIAREIKGKHFLNLFGYTGTATIHAALGGAASTTTVDLSDKYLQWARGNLVLNGLGERNNQFISSDVTEWLKADKGTYDFIFMDPPTFSNTKKERRIFDLQKDHDFLIRLAMQRLSIDGVLIFSTNSRKFQLSGRVGEEYRVKDITRESIPFDFSRNKRIHQCWEIQK